MKATSTLEMVNWVKKIQLNEVTATYKEDGVAFTVGVDAANRRFVSFEGKRTSPCEMFYDVTDFEDVPKNRPIRAALSIWKSWIGGRVANGARPGDRWNVELVGPELNIIQYRHFALIFLYPLSNSVDKKPSTPIEDLVFEDHIADITVPLWRAEKDLSRVFSVDEHHQAKIRRSTVARIPSFNAAFAFVDKHEAELLSRKHIHRETCNKFRKMVQIITSTFEGPLAEEGVVLRDRVGSMVKIVDPRFTLANQFAHAVRNCIKRRTFSNDYPSFFPSGAEVVPYIERAWAEGDWKQVSVYLWALYHHYTQAQEHRQLEILGHQTRYNPQIHEQTMLEFATFRALVEGK